MDKTLNQIASWIYYNQPVSQIDLFHYLGGAGSDTGKEIRTLLFKLTEKTPIYEEDDGKLGINLELPNFKSFHLREPTEL